MKVVIFQKLALTGEGMKEARNGLFLDLGCKGMFVLVF